MSYIEILEAVGTICLAADAFRAADIICLKIRREYSRRNWTSCEGVNSGKAAAHKDEMERNVNALLNYSAAGPVSFLAKWIYL